MPILSILVIAFSVFVYYYPAYYISELSISFLPYLIILNLTFLIVLFVRFRRLKKQTPLVPLKSVILGPLIGIFISSVVNQIICGVLVWRDHIKFHTFSLAHLSILLFLKLCWIIHHVIQIFWCFHISFNFPVILSSAFCLTEQVSNIIISASETFGVYENQQFKSIALILALSE